jgi:hypothetical protein
MTRGSLLIAVAVLTVAFGAVVWFVFRRRDRLTGPELLTGLPGVYLGFWSAVEGTKWLLLPSLILLAVGTLMQFVQVGRSAVNGMPTRSGDRLTGVKLTPVSGAAPSGMSPGRTRRWAGAAAMPGKLGLVTVTMPLACLTLGGSAVSLYLRPRLIHKILRVPVVSVTPADSIEVFPVGNPEADKGIGILLPQGNWCYFGTSAREEVLAALAESGFKVSWLERQVPL